MTRLYDLIYKIDNTLEGIYFDKIEGISVIGSPLSNALDHPIQYFARTNILPGMDDPFEGIGWTPTEAVRNLLKDIEAPPLEEEED